MLFPKEIFAILFLLGGANAGYIQPGKKKCEPETTASAPSTKTKSFPLNWCCNRRNGKCVNCKPGEYCGDYGYGTCTQKTTPMPSTTTTPKLIYVTQCCIPRRGCITCQQGTQCRVDESFANCVPEPAKPSATDCCAPEPATNLTVCVDCARDYKCLIDETFIGCIPDGRMAPNCCNKRSGKCQECLPGEYCLASSYESVNCVRANDPVYPLGPVLPHKNLCCNQTSSECFECRPGFYCADLGAELGGVCSVERTRPSKTTSTTKTTINTTTTFASSEQSKTTQNSTKQETTTEPITIY